MTRVAFSILLLIVASSCQSTAQRLATVMTPLPNTIVVTSPAFRDGQPIPAKYLDGRNVSPPINWSNLPDGTAGIVLLMEDADSPPPEPLALWIIYNIPSTMTGLPEGIPPDKTLKDKSGVMQGKGSHRRVGYDHPTPLVKSGLHHYHFEVFAINEMFPPLEGINKPAVLDNLDGRVLAKGELIGTVKR